MSQSVGSETREWLQPTVGGDVPPARAAHTTCVLADQLIMLGGSADFDSETGCKTLYSDAYSITTGT